MAHYKNLLIQIILMAHFSENDMIQLKDMFQIVATWLQFSTKEYIRHIKETELHGVPHGDGDGPRTPARDSGSKMDACPVDQHEKLKGLSVQWSSLRPKWPWVLVTDVFFYLDSRILGYVIEELSPPGLQARSGYSLLSLLGGQPMFFKPMPVLA